MKIQYIMMFMVFLPLRAQIGCMDNSKHTCTIDGYDYKNYHYVQCNCDCSRYCKKFDRGRCVRCGHFHFDNTL